MFDYAVLFFGTLFILLFGHCLADFSLQNDYVAKFKNRLLNPEPTWMIVMFGHCMVHAGIVYIITGSLFLGLVQLGSHYVIDTAKCNKWLGADPSRSYFVDQALHFAVLVFTAVVFTFF